MGYSPLINTFLELIVIDSESRNERAVCDYVKKKLQPFAASITEDDTGEKIGGNAGNLVVRIAGNAPGAPIILFDAHTDTVKPGNGIEPVIEGDIIRSKGETILGADDKAGLAVLLEAVRIIKEEKRSHGDLVLAITVSEETGLLGARTMDPALVSADYGFSLDTPGGAGILYNASPSHDTIKAVIKGKAAHAGMEPENGVSAIVVAARAIAKMNLGRIDEETTANIGIIKGGKATNIIPDKIALAGEARSRDPEKLAVQVKHMCDAIESAAAEAGAVAEITVEKEYKHYRIEEDAPVVQAAVKAAEAIGVTPEIRVSGGGSDANIFNEHGIPTIPIAAGMRGCHTTDESLSMSELDGILEWVLEIIEYRP